MNIQQIRETLLIEAAALFRTYEASHRARGPEHLEKAERNAEIASRIESALSSLPAEAQGDGAVAYQTRCSYPVGESITKWGMWKDCRKDHHDEVAAANHPEVQARTLYARAAPPAVKVPNVFDALLNARVTAKTSALEAGYISLLRRLSAYDMDLIRDALRAAPSPDQKGGG